jgi:RHS repeat-associated protein
MTQPVVCTSDVCFAPSCYTGKERDSESGNDYFGARYYASSMGRFMSPDWSAKEDPVPYAQLDDPQSLNLYSYVRNNPLTRVDADAAIFRYRLRNRGYRHFPTRSIPSSRTRRNIR